MKTVITTKLGVHKELPRFWTEGVKLLKAGIGFGKCLRYTPKFDTVAKRVVIDFHEEKRQGDLKVKLRNSRSDKAQQLPIVDVRSDELRSLFTEGQILRVAILDCDGVVRMLVTAHSSVEDKERREQRFKSRVAAGKPIQVTSLYHGTGIMDKALHKGFKDAGVASKVRIACEIEPKYIDNSLVKNPELFDDKSFILNMPIELLNTQTQQFPETDALFAGIPCTATCLQGRAKKKDTNDMPESDALAGAQFFYFLNVVKAANPALILIENSVHYAKDAAMAVIRTVLKTLGYKLEERRFHGNDYGALEARERFVCFAYSDGLEMADALHEVEALYQKPECVSEVLEDIELDSDLWRSFDYLHAKEIRDKAKGNSFSQQLLTGDEAKIGVLGRGYQKARSSEARILHPIIEGLSRLLTPKENAAVKTVPFEVVEGLPKTTAGEVLGQGVIFVVFEAIGFFIGKRSIQSASSDMQSVCAA